MTENCKDIQLCYYAACLAHYTKLGDGDAFSALHDVIGKSSFKSSLPKIEQLAQDYSELSLCLLECKLKEFRANSGVELEPSCGDITSKCDKTTCSKFPSSFLDFSSTAEATCKEGMKVTPEGNSESKSIISGIEKGKKYQEHSGSAGVDEGFKLAPEEDSQSGFKNTEAEREEIKETKDEKEQLRSSTSKSKKKKKKKSKSKKSSSKKDGIQDTSPTEPNIPDMTIGINGSDKSSIAESGKNSCCDKGNLEVGTTPSKEKTPCKPKNGIVPIPFGSSKDIYKMVHEGGAEDMAQENAISENKNSNAIDSEPLDSIQPEISFIIENLESFPIVDHQSVTLQTDTVSTRSAELHLDTVTSECAKLTFDTMPGHAVALPLDNVPDPSVTFSFGTVENYVSNSVKDVPILVPTVTEISTGHVQNAQKTNVLGGTTASKVSSSGPGSHRSKSGLTIVKPNHNASGKPPFDYHAAVEFLWNEWIQISK